MDGVLLEQLGEGLSYLAEALHGAYTENSNINEYIITPLKSY